MSVSNTPWKITGKWSVSMHNWAEDLRAEWKLPDHVKIHDMTLRDGEQTPGVVFRMDEKVKIGHALADIGVQRIEGGMPAVSPEDAEAITRMVKEIKNAEIYAFSRARRDDLDKALKCNVHGVILEMPARDDRLTKIWETRAEAAESTVELIKYAKRAGLKVTIFLVDFSRASLDDLKSLIIPAVKEGGADNVAVVDTRGVCLPGAVAFLVKKVKEWVNVPIEVHCHNYWGMGTATTLAAVTAGAEIVHTCVNGLGGNAALDECVMGIEGMIGLNTGINTTGLLNLTKMVQECSNSNWYKPFVGPTVADIEIGIATQRMWGQRDIPGMGRIDSVNYEVVGQKVFTLVLGKKSGRFSIMLKARELGWPIPTEEQASEILTDVKDLSEKNKAPVNNSDFKVMYDRVMNKK